MTDGETDGETDGQTDGQTELPYLLQRSALQAMRPRCKNDTERKSWRGPGLGELSKIWGFPFNIYTVAEASDFKFGTQLGCQGPS